MVDPRHASLPRSLILFLSLTAFAQAQDPLPRLMIDEAHEGVIENSAPIIETPTLIAGYTNAPTVGQTFVIEVDSAGPVTIELRSYYFDSYLVLRDSDGKLLAEDDNGLIALHGRLVASLEAGEVYRVQACALDGARGKFEVVLKRGAPLASTRATQAVLELEDAQRGVEATEGAESAALAKALNHLGFLVYRRGDYTQARPLWERALAIGEKVLGPEHPNTANSLNNLAGLLAAQGDYAAARPLLERALAIYEKVLGPEHPGTANSLSNLAELLGEQGDYPAARPLSERALAIREKVLGPEHPGTSTSLNNLAGLLKEQGDYAAARPLYERALTIREKVLGPEHPRTATSLNNLAGLFEEQGDYATARSLFERALAIREKVQGPEHPRTANALGNLAGLLKAQGDYAAARPLYERDLAIREKVQGPEHPDAAYALNKLASVLTDTGELQSAWKLVHRSNLSRRDRIEENLAAMSEGDRYPYLAKLTWYLELQLSLARELDDTDVRVAAYDALLNWKGRVGRLVTASRAQLMANMSGEQQALVEQLRRGQSELSQLVVKTAIPDRAIYDQRIAGLREQRGRIERELERLADSIGERSAASFSELHAGLPKGSALIDFFVHRLYQSGDGTAGTWTAPHLTAWITRKDQPLPIQLELGPAADIEAAISTFLRDLVAHRGIERVEEDTVDPGTALRTVLWDPLTPHLEGIDTIFVSPDGAHAATP